MPRLTILNHWSNPVEIVILNVVTVTLTLVANSPPAAWPPRHGRDLRGAGRSPLPANARLIRGHALQRKKDFCQT
jgi:hypothetical protein